MGTWSWYACDLRTGRAIAELPLTPAGTISRILCGTGSGTLRLPVTDPATPTDWWQATLPGRTLLVGDLDGDVAWAGIIWSRKLTDTPVVELACSTIESYLERRWIDYQLGPFVDTDQHQVVAALVQHANVSGINLQVDTSPPSGVRRARLEYERWADQRIFDQLDTLHQTAYGIEWTIDTTWDTEAPERHVLHTARVRTPHIGTVVAEPEWTFLYPGNVTSWELVENYGAGHSESGGYANVVVAGGHGNDADRIMSTPGIAQDTDALKFGWPLIEYRHTTDHTTVSGANAAARSMLAVLDRGTLTLAVTAHTDQIGFGSAWQLGDTCRVQLTGGSLPDTYTEIWRIVGWDIDPTNDQITPTLTPH